MSAGVPGPGGGKFTATELWVITHHIIRQQRLCDTLIADTQMGHSVPLSMGNTDMEPLHCDLSPDLWWWIKRMFDGGANVTRIHLQVSPSQTCYNCHYCLHLSLVAVVWSWLQNSTAGQTVAVCSVDTISRCPLPGTLSPLSATAPAPLVCGLTGLLSPVPSLCYTTDKVCKSKSL